MYVFVAYTDAGEQVLVSKEHDLYKWCGIDDHVLLLKVTFKRL